MAVDADITRLMKNVRVRLPGAIDTAIQLELFTAVDEFLKESNVWREDVEIDVTTDETEYSVESEESGRVNRLLYIKDAADIPVYGTMEVPGELVLVNEPNLDTEYTVTVALTVKDPTDSDGYPRFPAWIMDKYMSDLVDGVLGKMMTQIAKPWSNERMSIYHLRRFQAAKAKARSEADRKNVYRAQAWRFPGFSKAGRA